MTPVPAPRVRYHLLLPDQTDPSGGPLPVMLDADDVVAWVTGFATARGQQSHLEVISARAAEDTRRVQALQIGDAQGWFTFLYPEYPERTRG